ncbi:GNAT family N-acetyltransferase [Rhodoferax saidenbachensis]|uniref:GNAT family N-acetyltransferase n=2 Tax=Rhodoferax saidenbachensis TaxID=1484693 RepID=A0A1P8K734_9BURK|nr:GNAT family N-acetyltransferase [Rhodoferax saidenbachensis]APW41822.1 GNAT family N-acetyltransferase [Rhodoferax saidenbachensis]
MQTREGSLEEAIALLCDIPELQQGEALSYYAARVADHPHIVLIAEIDGQPAGFKVGYALSCDHFYSWVGGVLPAYRKRGIAQFLLAAQEEWVWANGYQRITVKTSHQFPAMVAMLEKNAYSRLPDQREKLVYCKTKTASGLLSSRING